MIDLIAIPEPGRASSSAGIAMPRFSIRNPYFIVVICLALAVIGITSLVAHAGGSVSRRSICRKWWSRRSIPACRRRTSKPISPIRWSASSPWPAASITWNRARCWASASSRSIFQPGTNADADVTQLSNLALADLKRLPPGTLPPVVLKFDASSLPVCLVTVKGEGLERNAASRSRAVPDPQSDRGGEGRGNSRPSSAASTGR